MDRTGRVMGSHRRVEQQILDERQPHAKHPLADGKAVCAGCVGDGAVWRQYAGGQVRVRPGKVGLEPFQVVVLPDKLDRDIAEDGICLFQNIHH